MDLKNCTTTDGSYFYQFPPLTTRSDFDPLKVEGSSTGSILSEDPGFDCGFEKVCAFEQSCGVKGPDSMLLAEPSFVCEEANCSNYLCRQAMDLISDCGELVEEKEVSMKPKGDRFRSKNLLTERKRRDRLKSRLYTLRGLVPKITKMDRLSTLVDSINYIKELQKKVNELEDELKNIELEDELKNMEELTNKNSQSPNLSSTAKKIDVATSGELINEESGHKQEPSSVQTSLEMETEVEVKQISVKEFFVKFLCEQKRRGFTKMMEAMSSLGLRVTDANVTTFKGMVLNILKVEADTEVVQAQKVKDLLLNLTRNDGCSSE